MAGRGRMSNGFHDLRDDDFHNSSELFNSHDSGGGHQMKQRIGNAKLHVTNIPPAVDEKGLSHIFASECSVPDFVFVSKNKHKNMQSNTLWGFVEYKTVAEAQSAIFAVHKKPPYELNVQFAKSSQDGNRSSAEKASQGNMGSRGRGQHQAMNGYRTNRSYEDNESTTDDYKGRDNSPDRFSSFGPPMEHNSREKLPSLPIEKYSHVEVSDEMDLHVAAYMSNRAKDLTLEDLSALCSEIKLALPFKPGKCIYCLRTAIYTCSRCKAWYCSDFCRATHWPQHKDSCAPRSVIFQKDGSLMYKDIPDAFCNEDAIKQNNLGGRSPRGNQGKIFGCDYRNDGFDNSAGFDKEMADNKIRSPDIVSRDNYRGSDRGNRNSQRNTRRGGDRQGFDRHGSDRQGFDRQGSDRQGFDRPGGGRSNGGRDKQFPTNCNSKTNGSDFNSTQHNPGSDNYKPQNNRLSFDKSPIPKNVFTEVTVGAFGNDGHFWAYKVEDYKKQGKILNELNEFSKQSGPSDLKIEVQSKCIASYQGDWYRGEITKVFRENVKVFFIDFGNESEIKKSELKPLPEHLISVPPMAHKYVLADSSGNPQLHEDFTFNIKPIKQDKQGSWIVHADGVKYNDLDD